MSSLPKRRRVILFKKRSYKPLYENVKANNNALAKALSDEKQETKYLYTQNIELTSQIQELGAACNKRDDIISGVLKNAKETLQLLVTMTSYVTNTIASCQQVVTTPRYTPRKSTSNNRRDSTRRMSGKSPARGVVQPMVSGHTITKPTINLSRLNIQREYRIQNPPNLSDIEEVLTPTQSPSVASTPSPVRIPIARSLNYGTRRVHRLPERFQPSLGSSDENDRRSSGSSNRKSSRHSARRSRRSSQTLSEDPTPRPRSTSELQASEGFKSPRVALHDVSRLLQNSQSVNIRTLLENSSDADMTQPSSTSDRMMETSSGNLSQPEPEGIILESPEESGTDANATFSPPEPSKSKSFSKKMKTSFPNDEEDPLEGPSWLLNGTENDPFSTQDEATSTVNNSTRHQNTKDHAKSNKPAINEEDEEEEEEEEEDEEEEKRSEVAAAAQRDERTANLTTRCPKPQINFYQYLQMDDDCTATTNFASFVTSKRGSSCNDDNEDDFTLLWKRQGAPKNYDFDLNDLVLPVLESPIVAAAEPRILEPEPTTNIQRINPAGNSFAPVFPGNNGEETFFDHTGLMLPAITENLDTPRASAVVEQEEQSDREEVAPRKRKLQYQKKTIIDSDSDSEWAPAPKKPNNKSKRKNSKTKDPSSAKVVLQKLNDTHVKKRTPSPETRRSAGSERQRPSSSMSLQRDGSNSDSEGSNASSTAKSVPSRPRRQKAPKNLQEPSLGKKMRRN